MSMVHSGKRMMWGGAGSVLAVSVVLAAFGTMATAQTAIRDYDLSLLDTMPRNDDGSTGSVGLGFDFNYFGTTYDSVFVNTNGNVSFDQALSDWVPPEFSETGLSFIAPFFSDVDTRLSGEPVRYGNVEIAGRNAFVVNWIDVDSWPPSSSNTEFNSFQLVIIDRSDRGPGEVDIEFNYGTIVWDQDGRTRIGWTNGSGEEGTFYEFEGSYEAGAFLDGGPVDTSLLQNSLNSGILGRYLFYTQDGVLGWFDLAGAISGFESLANDTSVMSVQQQDALGHLIRSGSIARAGQWVFSTSARVDHTGRNPTTVGARTSSLGTLSFGYGISDTFTLGATVSLSGTSLKNNAFDMDTGLGAAIWGQYSEDGAARTGLQFSGALGYMRTEGEVARGRLLTDVALATGRSTVETRAVHALLGYGFQQGDWLVTPSLGMVHYDTTRAAYSETGAAFNASYDEMSTSRTVATLGVTGEFGVGEQGSVSLGVGVDHEINLERPRLTGTSDIPGLATFDIDSTFAPNRTRAFATAGYTHDFGRGSTISGDLRVGEAVYGTTPSVGFGVTYGLRF